MRMTAQGEQTSSRQKVVIVISWSKLPRDGATIRSREQPHRDCWRWWVKGKEGSTLHSGKRRPQPLVYNVGYHSSCLFTDPLVLQLWQEHRRLSPTLRPRYCSRSSTPPWQRRWQPSEAPSCALLVASAVSAVPSEAHLNSPTAPVEERCYRCFRATIASVVLALKRLHITHKVVQTCTVSHVWSCTFL